MATSRPLFHNALQERNIDASVETVHQTVVQRIQELEGVHMGRLEGGQAGTKGPAWKATEQPSVRGPGEDAGTSTTKAAQPVQEELQPVEAPVTSTRKANLHVEEEVQPAEAPVKSSSKAPLPVQEEMQPAGVRTGTGVPALAQEQAHKKKERGPIRGPLHKMVKELRKAIK